MSSPQHSTTAPRVRYEQATAMHASQVIVNTVEETMFLECSSGFVLDEESGSPVLPIHTRLAISPATARDLGELLISVADEIESELLEESNPPEEEVVEEYASPEFEVGDPEDSAETLLNAIGMHSKVETATRDLPQWS